MAGPEARERMEQAMKKIEDFYFGDDPDAGEQLFKRFAVKHSQHFRPGMNPFGEENKLEYTAAYQEFQELFEKKLDELISSEGLTVPQFFNLINEASSSDEDCAVFIQILLAVSDYPSFMEMMSSYCAEQQK